MADTLLGQRVDAIRRLARRGHAAPLGKVVAKARPEDIAAVIGHLTAPEQRLVFSTIKQDAVAADVLSRVHGEDLLHLITDLAPERVATLLGYLPGDDQTDVIERLPEETREAVLARMKRDEREEVEELLGYAPDTAGGIMSPTAFTLRENITCRDAIAAVQAASDQELIYYAYVENEEGQLVGVTSLRNLLTHPPSTKLSDIMSSDVIAVRTETDQEEVARIAGRYDLLAVPVVDDQRHLVGIVTVDDVIDVIREEAAEDMLLMAGVREPEEEPAGSRLWGPARRLPWLLVTLAGGLGISELIHHFDPLLKSDLVLAGFIPIVMGMEGNVGIQSATVTVRGIATGRIDSALGKAVGQEVFNGVVLGMVFALIIGGYSYVRFQDSRVSLSVAIAVVTGMTSASLVGTLVPLTLRRLGVDPAIATGPFVTTAMDGLGLTIYLTTAFLLLGSTGA
ncbi:magnesium transporter MgtE [Deltaproteobacteria bacterium]|nr:magnesium transporter MgtE [Deltaproteobacteria bacterium]